VPEPPVELLSDEPPPPEPPDLPFPTPPLTVVWLPPPPPPPTEVMLPNTESLPFVPAEFTTPLQLHHQVQVAKF